MEQKDYAIVCRCNGKNLKAFENLDFYHKIGRKHKQHWNVQFKKW